MDRDLLQHYERELRFMRELGAEFARRFPKVAGRLGITELACDDPHVERLMQGFAFLSAGVSQRLDAEFPRFTAELMHSVFPQYLGPTPSMVIVQFAPSAQAGALSSGYTVSKGSALRTRVNQRGAPACEFRTAHAVELWPIEIEELEYTSVLRDIADLHLPSQQPIRGLVRLRLRTTNGRPFNQLRLQRLPLFLCGEDERTARLHEALIAHSNTVVARWGKSPALHAARSTAARPVRAVGFEEDEALLPRGPAGFRAYRLLQEYFAFPQRFHFVELAGLDAAVARCDQSWMDILVPLTRHDPTLQGEIDKQRLLLFATPAVNLFPRTCDRISVTDATDELQVVPDRARPLDYEVHSITRVSAYLPGHTNEIEFLPQRAMRGRLEPEGRMTHYALERRARIVGFSETQQRLGQRATYPGTDVFVRLVDGLETVADKSCQLSVETLCTNRDLPLSLTFGEAESDFSLDSGAPVIATRCVVGPTAPRTSGMAGERAWRLINQLSLNYLSICQETGGVEALREILSLNAQFGDPALRRQAEGIRDVHTTPVIRPMPVPGPRTFVRGLEITLVCEEQAFSTHGFFTLASVLSEFFAKYAPMNSFTETVLRTPERGEIYRWPAVAGLRHVL